MNPKVPGRGHTSRASWLALLTSMLLLGGCTSAGVATSPTPIQNSTVPSSAPSSSVSSATPAPTATPTPAPTATPTPAPTVTPTDTPSVAPPPAGTYVIVRPGDTLWDIAQQHGLTVAELIAANDPSGNWDRDWDVLTVGERIELWRDLLSSPDGTLYGVNYDIHFKADYWPVHSSRIAALGPDGEPLPGWPYLTPGRASRPVFGADGTLYLALSAGPEWDDSPGTIVALGPDGRVKRGWPYHLPGSFPFAEPGPGPVVSVPQPPTVAPDGSIYGTFYSGIYRVRPDGRAAAGWPYLLPSGTGVARCCFGDTPGPPEGDVFKPVRTDNGRFYLPRIDCRSGTGHPDMMCLLDDGSFCSGWPVKLPDGTAVEGAIIGFSVDEQGIVEVGLVDVDEFDESGDLGVAIKPDGTLLYEVEDDDTLSGLADLFGVTQSALLAVNPQVTDASQIRPGEVLIIPKADTTQ